jgi:hypothetical protein
MVTGVIPTVIPTKSEMLAAMISIALATEFHVPPATA